MAAFCLACKSSKSKDPEKIFYSFPHGKQLKQDWLKFAGADENFPLTHFDGICRDHFLPEHFLTNGHLKPKAIPCVVVDALEEEENTEEEDEDVEETEEEKAAFESDAAFLDDENDADYKPITKKSKIVKSKASVAKEISEDLEDIKNEIKAVDERKEETLNTSRMSINRFSSREEISNAIATLQAENEELKNEISQLVDTYTRLKEKKSETRLKMRKNFAKKVEPEEVEESFFLKLLRCHGVAPELLPDDVRNFAVDICAYSPTIYAYLKDHWGEVLPPVEIVQQWIEEDAQPETIVLQSKQ